MRQNQSEKTPKKQQQHKPKTPNNNKKTHICAQDRLEGWLWQDRDSTKCTVYRRTATPWRKEGHVSFNDALNTLKITVIFYVGHMVKDHSDSDKENTLPPLHGLLFPISSKVCFIYAPSHRQDSAYYGICYTSRAALAGTRHWLNGSTMRDDPSHHERTLYHRATSRSATPAISNSWLLSHLTACNNLLWAVDSQTVHGTGHWNLLEHDDMH